MPLSNKRILLGVTGGIAAYKSLELVRLLQKAGASVEVVMTSSATQFVTPLSFQTLSGKPVALSMWDDENGIAHIALTRRNDVVLIAPATADFLAKTAHGLADDLLSTTVLARTIPLVVAPAMNVEMWQNPATVRNLATLQADGVLVIPPASGTQACGEIGEGRMPEPAFIKEYLAAHFADKCLVGKRVLITAGPTFEAIDPVRGITNLSSGKMGFALARAAAFAGAKVRLIAGPVPEETPLFVDRTDVKSARQMHEAVMQEIEAQDIFISVAAVADYRPSSVSTEKLKKSEHDLNTLHLTQNPDILAAVAALKHPPFCVGFAAETHNLKAYATQKRQSKNIPLIVGNLMQDGFGTDDNVATLFEAEGETPYPKLSKDALATAIVAHIAKRVTKG